MGRQKKDDKVYFRYNMLITSINLLNICEDEQQEIIDQIDELIELLQSGAKL